MLAEGSMVDFTGVAGVTNVSTGGTEVVSRDAILEEW